jgi:MFS family permease
MGGLLGGVVGQAPLAAFVAATDWRTAMWVLAAAGLGMAVLIFAVVRDRPPAAPGAPPRRAESLGDALRGLGIVVRRPQTLLIALVAMMLSTPILAFGGLWGVPFARLVYGVDRPEAAFLISTSLFGLAAGGPAWGWISDRIGRRRAPMLWGTALSLVSICAILYVPDLPKEAFRVLLFLFGFGGAAMAVSYAAVREHNADGATGAALGLVNMMAVLGGAIFQPLVGLVLDWLWAAGDGRVVDGLRVYDADMYTQALTTLPAICAVGIFACCFVRETYCRPIGEAAPA